MNKKPKKYHVVTWNDMGEDDKGVSQYYPKWVSAWPSDASKWGARYEVSPHEEDALSFGRDAALYVAHEIRLRNGSWAMVEEA